jgi:hypothetical protein
MQLEFATWLDMVWEALSDEDGERRVARLKEAQKFLETSREQKVIPPIQETQASSRL